MKKFFNDDGSYTKDGLEIFMQYCKLLESVNISEYGIREVQLMLYHAATDVGLKNALNPGTNS